MGSHHVKFFGKITKIRFSMAEIRLESLVSWLEALFIKKSSSGLGPTWTLELGSESFHFENVLALVRLVKVH